MSLTSLSKFLSYILRHHPESIDLTLDPNGWAKISELIDNAEQHGKKFNYAIIAEVLNHGDKQRFIISDDGEYIRASYGHSIDVDLQMKPKKTPTKLYHGTAKKNVASIFEEGIIPGSRNFVHLSAERADAKQVGSRHGTPVVLVIRSAAMSKEGYEFYQSESEPNIWLTKKVPVEYVGNAF